jgi:hypothetical protein
MKILINLLVGLLLLLTTVNTGIFVAISSVSLFVGSCVNLPLLYVIGWIRGSK